MGGSVSLATTRPLFSLTLRADEPVPAEAIQLRITQQSPFTLDLEELGVVFRPRLPPGLGVEAPEAVSWWAQICSGTLCLHPCLSPYFPLTPFRPAGLRHRQALSSSVSRAFLRAHSATRARQSAPLGRDQTAWQT